MGYCNWPDQQYLVKRRDKGKTFQEGKRAWAKPWRQVCVRNWGFFFIQAWHHVSFLYALPNLVLPRSLWDRNYLLHFTDEKIEAQLLNKSFKISLSDWKTKCFYIYLSRLAVPKGTFPSLFLYTNTGVSARSQGCLPSGTDQIQGEVVPHAAH